MNFHGSSFQKDSILCVEHSQPWFTFNSSRWDDRKDLMRAMLWTACSFVRLAKDVDSVVLGRLEKIKDRIWRYQIALPHGRGE